MVSARPGATAVKEHSIIQAKRAMPIQMQTFFVIQVWAGGVSVRVSVIKNFKYQNTNTKQAAIDLI